MVDSLETQSKDSAQRLSCSQVEVALLESKGPSGKGIAGAADTAQPLLDALTDTILDAGSPAVCDPFLTALFQRAAKSNGWPVPPTASQPGEALESTLCVDRPA